MCKCIYIAFPPSALCLCVSPRVAHVCVCVCVCARMHLYFVYSLSRPHANEIFIYFSERGGGRVARKLKWNVISHCVSPWGGCATEGIEETELLLNYIRRIQRGVITGRRGRGKWGGRQRERERGREEKEEEEVGGETSHSSSITYCCCCVCVCVMLRLSHRQPAGRGASDVELWTVETPVSC